jgi:anti-anti-sigma factor
MNEEPAFTYSLDDRPDANATLLRLNGPLDTFTYPALKTLLARWSRGELGGTRDHLAVDFGGVPFCASSGWSALFLQNSLAKERGRSMVIFNVGERVAHSLDLLARGSNLIRVAPDEASALKALGQDALQASKRG